MTLTGSKTRIILGAALLSIGIILLTICLIGEFGVGTNYFETPVRPWERFDPKLGERTRDIDSFFSEVERRYGVEFNNLSTPVAMDVLFNAVCERFSHRQARYTLFSNWILWMLGKLRGPIGAIHEPNYLLKYGNIALCDQQSFVLVFLALERGIRARHVGLGGHIVMEAWYNNDWHMYDPDEEVSGIDPESMDKGVQSVEFLSKRPDLTRKLYSGHRSGPILKKIVRFFMTRENNTFVSVPKGSWYNWKSQFLMMFERICAYLKWIIPVCIVLLGVGLIIFSRKGRA